MVVHHKNPLVSVVELGRLLCFRPATLTFSDTADFVKLIRKKTMSVPISWGLGGPAPALKECQIPGGKHQAHSHSTIYID